MNKRFFPVFFLSLLSLFPSFSEDSVVYSEAQNENQEKQDSTITIEKPVKHFFLCFEPFVLVNTKNTTKSAPSPIIFPLTAGIEVPLTSKLNFFPRLTLFMNNYLWDGDNALPAEIENRTGTAFCFLFDFPVGTQIFHKKNHSIDWSAGPALLARFAFVSNGVDKSDSGTNGTAEDDVQDINKWFWSDANFLYLTANINYLYHFYKKFAAGPELRFYLPLGSLFTGNGLNGAIISFGLKARF